MPVSFSGLEAPEHPADCEAGPQCQRAREGHWHGQARRGLDAFQGLRGEEQHQRGALCPGAGQDNLARADYADYTKVGVMFFTLTPDDMDDAAPSLYVNQLLAFEDRTRQPLCR